MTATVSVLRRVWNRLDPFDLSLISLVTGYTLLILAGFLLGNAYLLMDGLVILFSLFVFLGTVILVQSLRKPVERESLKLSDKQFVVVALSIIGSLGLSLWIGPWSLIMGLLFIPAITTAIFAMAFRNKQEKSEYHRLASKLGQERS